MPSPLVGASADGGDFLAIDDRNEGLHPGGGCAGSRNSDSSYLRSEEKIDGQWMCKDLRAIDRVTRKFGTRFSASSLKRNWIVSNGGLEPPILHVTPSLVWQNQCASGGCAVGLGAYACSRHSHFVRATSS